MASCGFNSDVLFEILSRADLKTMSKCRLLSRECNTLTYTSSFMRSHCERTNTIRGYLFCVSTKSRAFWRVSLIPGVHPKSIDSNFLRLRSFRILAGVDIGLFFCKVGDFDSEIRYFVCKLTTSQWQVIPTPTSRDSSQPSPYFMTVLKLKPLKFKILRLKPHGVGNFNCEIFDSDIWAWKQLDELNLPDSQSLQDYRHAISVCGRLYWIMLIQDEYKILIFDQDKENWAVNLVVPDPCKNRILYEVKLSVYGGKVAIMGKRRDTETVEVWVLRYYRGATCWSKMQTIFNLENLKHPGLVSFSNADTVLTWDCFTADRPTFCNFQYRDASGFIKDSSEIIDNRSVYFFQTDYERIPGLRSAI